MQNVKKYFTEGLIQFTILLSLIGVRVDVDSYFSPLLEISLGPSSAYIQTPFHSLRDTWDGYSVHPKCPELDYFFASRRILEEVRALGSPRFPTQLDAWLVHQVPDSSELGEPSNHTSHGGDGTSEGPEDNANDSGPPNDEGYLAGGAPLNGRPEECHTAAQQLSGPGPFSVAGACEEDEEVKSAPRTQAQGQIDGHDDDDGGGGGGGSDYVEEPANLPVTQLALSSTLEQEALLGGPLPPSSLSDPEDAPPTAIDWSHFLSLPVPDFDDLDPQRLSDLDPDISSAISQDVSLRDAVVAGAGSYDAAPPRLGAGSVAARRRGPLLRLESTNSSHSDSSPGTTTAAGLRALPFASAANGTQNATSHGALGGCLDEAVFDQINLLGLEGLEAIDAQLLGSLEDIDPRVLEDLDSDSGLSLESSSRGPASPGSSEVSSTSSSSSFCDDEGGATGYSSDVDSLPSKGVAYDYDAAWSPVDPSEGVWHDHSYSSAPCLRPPPPAAFPYKTVKEEPPSDGDEYEDEREPSRDELRARAMCIPFSVPQVVNMPVEDFLELLEGRGLSPAQVALLRDIRRRGKNKLAAQNCRKRKLDAIAGLQEEVARLQAQRDRLLGERRHTAKALGAAGQQIERLSRDVLAGLRDELGRPLTPDRYTLQCGAGGRVAVQPISGRVVAATTAAAAASNKTDKRKKEKKP